MDITYFANYEEPSIKVEPAPAVKGLLVRFEQPSEVTPSSYRAAERVLIYLSVAQATELVRQLVGIDGVADGVQAALDHHRYGVGVPS